MSTVIDVKLLITDLDGTLLIGNTLPQNATELIHTLQDEGVHLCFATGRMWHSPCYYTERFKKPISIVGCNGAIVQNEKGERIGDFPLPKEFAQRIIKQALENGDYIQCYTEDTVYLSGYRQDPLDRYKKEDSNVLQTTFIITQNILDYVKDEKIYKLVFIVEDDEERLAMRRIIEEENSIAVTESGFSHLEITHERATKGQALQLLAKDLGVRLTDTIAIGDHENDVSMLEAAGLSIGVHGGHDISQFVDMMVAPPMENGWVHGVKKYVMGDKR